MSIVWKFPLFDKAYDSPDVPVNIRMPIGAKILKVGFQHDNPVLWALVDNLEEREERTFVFVATGQDSDHIKSDSYIGTFIVPSTMLGDLVWHVFEVTKDPGPPVHTKREGRGYGKSEAVHH